VNGFKGQITLSRNSRGCYILDTVKGCSGCNSKRPRGCYGDCYSWNIAARYGRDFSNIVSRDFTRDYSQFRLFDFDDAKSTSDILRAIKKIKMPFVRIGELGDPSEDWEHTLNVCRIVQGIKKQIVIITKHWKIIPDTLLPDIKNITINTSVSALDDDSEIEHRLFQYERLKNYCNSILRIVSCDFNKENKEGNRRSITQDVLFNHGEIIDTVFRPTSKNPLVANGIINTKRIKFLKNTMLASMHNPSAYLGVCDECPDMCGIDT
jgi:hypothetical protein